MTSAVLDASALLALLNQEEGGDVAADAVAAGATLSSVNLAEVAAKLMENGMPEGAVRDALGPLGIEVVALDEEGAFRVGALRARTRHLGLSLGDRACIALAEQLNLPVITADRAWASLELGVEIRIIR